MIQTKSAVEPKKPTDGYRILVDPTWPKGLPKGKAGGVDWIKQLYPSANLRDFMRRNPRKVNQFTDSYLLELAQKDSVIEKIRDMHGRYGNVTIVTAPGPDEWGIYKTLVRYLSATAEV